MKKAIKMMAAAAALTIAAFTADAQDLSITRVGDVTRADGSRAYVVAATTVAVDITLVRETVRTGPYARFAQRYFGVIAPLADKDTYRLISASIGYYQPDSRPDMTPATLPAPRQETFSHRGSESEFPRVLPDRRSTANRTLEESAADAAQAIFNLRKRRAELVTGDYAETVYGAGLQAAIERIDQMENEYLELFFGKQTSTTYTMRYLVTPQTGSTNTVVCRFRDDAGLMPDNDLSGEPIILECRPEGKAASLYQASDRRTKFTDVEYAVADVVNCRVTEGRNELGRATIPMYQYGVVTRMPAQ